MCHDCFPGNVYHFDSEQEFIRLEAVIRNKIRQYKLRESKPHADDVRYQPDALYQCQTCHLTWALALPDNAWRGYLLTLDSAAAFRRKLQRNDRFKTVVGIICLLSFGVSILWAVLQ